MDPFTHQPRRRSARPSTAGADSRDYRSFEYVLDSPGAGGSGARVTASKIVSSVKRSFTVPRRRESTSVERGMYSTPEESSTPVPPRHPFADRDARDTRPTIEQIAMGLHVSRTPHLRPVHIPSSHLARLRSSARHPQHASDGFPHTHSYPDSVTSPPASLRPGAGSQHRRYSAGAEPITVPRSSLKRRSASKEPPSAQLTPSASDVSLSTLTSNTPSTPRSARTSVPFIPARLQQSMSRLLPSRKGSLSGRASVATAGSSSDDDAGSATATQRKVVRFSVGVHEDGDP